MCQGQRRRLVFYFLAVALSAFVVGSQECAHGQYWCQDRCGTDRDTCCETPSSKHNLCGPGTICCGFGCCPDSTFTCNADFSCTGPDGQIIPPVPNPDDSGNSHPTTYPTTLEPSSQGIASTTDVNEPTHYLTQPIDTISHPLEAQPSTMSTVYTGPAPESTVLSSTVSMTSSITHIDHGSEALPSTGTIYDSTTEAASVPRNSMSSTEISGSTSKAGPVVVIGTETVAIPEVTLPTTLVTMGHTFTIAPTLENPTGPYPTFVVIGSETATLPSVSKATTIVTLDSTFTLFPPTFTSPIPGSMSPPDGTSSSAPISPTTSPATRAPTGPESTGLMASDTTGPARSPPWSSSARTNPGLSSTGSIVAIVGTETWHFPSVNLDSTMTTRGRTITLVSGGPPTITIVEPSEEPSSTEPSATVDVTTFTTWPPQALITPVELSVEKPEPSEDEESAVIPCSLWFFSLCIRFDDINILGWKIILPPGIYPPHLRLDQIIKLPQSISIQGELPPWPKFTIGNDHVPTFPSNPEPTKCETKTASFCATTTSVVVSTVDGALATVVTGAPVSTCAEMRGCLVADSTQEATVTTTATCETATVSDIIVTCSGGGATACSTRTKDPRAGCDVTATTTTVSCTPAPSETNKRQASEGDVPTCPMTYEYVIWPRDGKRNDETSAVHAEIQKMLPDGGEIKVSAVKDLRVNFWRVLLYPEQAESVRTMPNVASIYRTCAPDCSDPTLQDSKISWRYQNQYLDEQLDWEDHRAQMSYISANEGSQDDRYNQNYYFDVSAGEDVPVYIVDTGATMDHIEFNIRDKIASKTEFIFVDKDFDGQQHRDDSHIPEGGRCPPVGKCKPHGTSMLSIIAGATIGITKKVKPIMVRVPRLKENGGGARTEDWINAMSAVADAFSDKSTTTRAVLCLAQGHRFQDFKADWEHRNKEEGQDNEKLLTEAWVSFRESMHGILTDLIQKGVFVVTGAGNDGVIHALPAAFSSELTKDFDLSIPELLVVGAAHPDEGHRWWMSGQSQTTADAIPHIYAPGANLLVANGNRNDWPESSQAEAAYAEKRQNGNKKSHYKFSQGTSDATAYTAGLAAYFLKLHQLGRLGLDAKGNEPDMSPGGLKRYIINNGWVRQNSRNDGRLGIWNGASVASLEREGFCPYIAGTTNMFRIRRQEVAALTGQCVPGTSPTASAGSTRNPSATATATDSDTVAPTAIPTTFVCTEKTANKCAPGVICSAPQVNGCVDGKCVCVLPDLPAPTSFVCTERTVDKCAPGVICSAPQINGCVDGKCVCVLPDLPSKTSVIQTTLSTVTSKSPDPVPTPTEEPKTPVVPGERKCNDASIYTGKTDIWKTSVYDSSVRACAQQCKTPMTADSETRRSKDTWGGVRYDMSISWKSGCVSVTESIKCGNPMEDRDMNYNTACAKFFQDNWEKCTANKGRGGYIDVGCLRYDFTPK